MTFWMCAVMRGCSLGRTENPPHVWQVMTIYLSQSSMTWVCVKLHMLARSEISD